MGKNSISEEGFGKVVKIFLTPPVERAGGAMEREGPAERSVGDGTSCIAPKASKSNAGDYALHMHAVVAAAQLETARIHLLETRSLIGAFAFYAAPDGFSLYQQGP